MPLKSIVGGLRASGYGVLRYALRACLSLVSDLEILLLKHRLRILDKIRPEALKREIANVPTTSSSSVTEVKPSPLPSTEPSSIQLLFVRSSSASESIKSETTHVEIRESETDLKRKFKEETSRSTPRKESSQLLGPLAGQSTEVKSENVKMESAEDKEKTENQSESDSKATGLSRMSPAQLGNPLDAIQV
ncbi:hypothetical protein Ddc_10335 [Ditylenchus destructor]|nr:hypothetical protein Ddc_10335 [Ditylenchus destructor]